MTKNALVLLSGGLDSTTLLAYVLSKKEYDTVKALNIFYGQKNDKEQKSAKQVSDYYDVPIEFMDLSKIFENSDCALIAKNKSDVSEKNDFDGSNNINEYGEATTYVPFRNGVFLSIATSVAYSNNCGSIFYAIVHGLNDIQGAAYPDCSKKFIRSMSDAISYGTENNINLFMPFKNMDKSEVLKLGMELKVPYELTWSCYTNDDIPCGRCHACIEREKAFLGNNIIDPLFKGRSICSYV